MIAFLLTLGSVLCNQADTAMPETLSADVRRLFRQLDDDTLAAREAAERALIGLGPQALELLPPVTGGTSAEVKVRMDRIRQSLQKAAAETAARGARINLQGEMKLSAALAAMQQQSGNQISDFRQRFGQQPSDPTIRADFQDTPFWQAFDQILDQAGLTVYNYSGQPGALAVVARAGDEYARSDRAAYSGLFRFEGISLLARRDLRNPENDSLRLTLEVGWEPRVAPIVLQLPLDQVQAVDESGRPLSVEAGPGRLEIPAQGDIPATEIQIPFALPGRDAHRIARLQGRLDALLPGRTHEFVFADLENAKAVEQRRAGVTATLEQVRKNVDLYEARVRVRFDRADTALESHRGWVYNNAAYLLDADGQRIEHAGMQATLQREDEVGVSYLFDHEGPLQGCKFVYKTPVLIVSLPIEFELTELALP